MIEDMPQSFMNRLRRSGWHVPLKECSWSRTALDEEKLEANVDGFTIKRVGRSDVFKALGTTITVDNGFQKEIENRIKKAWATFAQHRSLFKFRKGSLKKRLVFLDMSVKQSLLRGSGSWNLTVHDERTISGVQRKMIRAMLSMNKTTIETIPDYMSRCESAVSKTMHNYQIEPWVTAWRRVQYERAGKIVQHGARDPARLTGHVLDWKGIESIHRCAREHKGWQGHPHRLYVWRWEKEIYHFFRQQGMLWKDVALDHQALHEHLEDI